jgi:hypothetical protein
LLDEILLLLGELVVLAIVVELRKEVGKLYEESGTINLKMMSSYKD